MLQSSQPLVGKGIASVLGSCVRVLRLHFDSTSKCTHAILVVGAITGRDSLDKANMQLKVSRCFAMLLLACIEIGAAAAEPSPPVWPETFHALAVQNRNGSLALVDLYYEWKKGRNANLIHRQLGTTLYDIE